MGGVQLELLRALLLNGVIIARVQLECGAALAVCGDGVHQSVVIGAADFEGDVGDALLLVACHHLDQLEIASGGVVER